MPNSKLKETISKNIEKVKKLVVGNKAKESATKISENTSGENTSGENTTSQLLVDTLTELCQRSENGQNDKKTLTEITSSLALEVNDIGFQFAVFEDMRAIEISAIIGTSDDYIGCAQKVLTSQTAMPLPSQALICRDPVDETFIFRIWTPYLLSQDSSVQELASKLSSLLECAAEDVKKIRDKYSIKG
jgi:hypothetical protein